MPTHTQRPRLPGAARFLLVGLVWITASGPSFGTVADGGLEAWRSEAAALRLLADVDAPRAYEAAKPLHDRLPSDAPAADRARALNILARIELNMALPGPAQQHAEQALQLARRDGDKAGQAEANLNLSLNAISQGRIAAASEAASTALSLLDGVDRPDLLSEAMVRTAMEYRRNGETDVSITIVMQAMEIAQRNGNPLALAYAHEGLAVSYEQSGRFEEALHHFTQARDYARVVGSRLIEARGFRGMASTQTKLGRLDIAEIHALEAVALFRAAGMPFHLAFGLFGYAEVLRLEGRIGEASDVLDEVVEIYGSRQNRLGLWWALDARAGNHLALGEFAAARADVEAAYNLARQLDTALYLAKSARRLGTIAAAEGDYTRAYALEAEASAVDSRVDAEKSSQRIVRLAERYQSESKQRQIDELTRREQRRALEQRWLWTVLAGSVALLVLTAAFLVRLGRSNRELKALNAVVEESRRQLQLSEQTFRAVVENSPDCIVRYDRDLRRAYMNPSILKIFGRPAHELIGTTVGSDSPNRSPQGYVAQLQQVVETGQELIEESSFVNAEGELRWGQTRLVPEFGATGEVASVLAIGRDLTTLVEAQHRLEQSRTQLRELAARRETAREEERRRIAREIHDELGQQLTALRLKVNLLDFRYAKSTPALHSAFTELLGMVDGTIQVVRNVATSLRPAVLDMGIVPALEWLAAEFRRNTGIPCQLAAVSGDLRPSEEKAVVLFRTAQEALTNAARHARAQRIRITIGMQEDHYVLGIEDDGVGFTPDIPPAPKSFGLVGMRERALAVGGEAIISSTPGQGTTVNIRIPFDAPVRESTWSTARGAPSAWKPDEEPSHAPASPYTGSAPPDRKISILR